VLEYGTDDTEYAKENQIPITTFCDMAGIGSSDITSVEFDRQSSPLF
jgi:hypothetical protein